jgi:hypothetical protein
MSPAQAVLRASAGSLVSCDAAQLDTRVANKHKRRNVIPQAV